jgi:hypothetical protein
MDNTVGVPLSEAALAAYRSLALAVGQSSVYSDSAIELLATDPVLSEYWTTKEFHNVRIGKVHDALLELRAAKLVTPFGLKGGIRVHPFRNAAIRPAPIYLSDSDLGVLVYDHLVDLVGINGHYASSKVDFVIEQGLTHYFCRREALTFYPQRVYNVFQWLEKRGSVIVRRGNSVQVTSQHPTRRKRHKEARLNADELVTAVEQLDYDHLAREVANEMFTRFMQSQEEVDHLHRLVEGYEKEIHDLKEQLAQLSTTQAHPARTVAVDALRRALTRTERKN